MLTYFQSDIIRSALNRANDLANEAGCDEDLQLIATAKKHLLAAMKDNMPIGEHEDDIEEVSEPDQRVSAMRGYWNWGAL